MAPLSWFPIRALVKSIRSTIVNLCFLPATLVSGVMSLPAVVKASDALYFCDATGLYRAAPDGSGVTLLFPNWETLVQRLDVDVTGAKLYFSIGRSGGHVLARTDMNGETYEPLAGGGTYVLGVGIDASARKVYWTRGDILNPYLHWIERASLDSFTVEPAVSVVVPSLSTYFAGVGVDPLAGKMYWSVHEGYRMGTGRIQRADLDGQNVETFVTGLDNPLDLALDVVGRKLYWTEWGMPPGLGGIARTDLTNGQHIEDLVVGLGNPIGIDVDRDAGKMYWADWGAGKVYRANLDGSSIETVLSGRDQPIDVRVIRDTPTSTGSVRPGELHVTVLRDGRGHEFALALPQFCRVHLDLFTVTGRRMKSLVDGDLPAGTHHILWDGSRYNGGAAPSGLYFYRIDLSSGQSRVGKLLVLR